VQVRPLLGAGTRLVFKHLSEPSEHRPFQGEGYPGDTGRIGSAKNPVDQTLASHRHPAVPTRRVQCGNGGDFGRAVIVEPGVGSPRHGMPFERLRDVHTLEEVG